MHARAVKECDAIVQTIKTDLNPRSIYLWGSPLRPNSSTVERIVNYLPILHPLHHWRSRTLVPPTGERCIRPQSTRT